MKKIAIIGAGAAGLFAAKMLSADIHLSITVFEKAQKVATKLRASGGGRANLMNTHIDGSSYNHPDFIDNLLEKVDYEVIKHEFEKMGLRFSIDEEGRVYPATLFSQTVIDVLFHNLGDNVQIITDFEVKKLQKTKGKWQINNEKTLYDAILMASGSPAGMIAKNRQSYNGYLSDLKLIEKNTVPSLVGFKLKKYPKELSGCRARAAVTLWQNGKAVYTETGEVMFKDDGISGIVVLNVSAYYNRLKTKENCSLSLNFLFDDDHLDVSAYLKKFGDFSGLLHPKLNRLYQKKPFNLRNFQMEIASVYDMEFAQVCHGGIALEEVDDTFALRRHPHLYAVGEMLDIDGICGGYNLFFAFASAYCASKAILRNSQLNVK